MRIYRQKFYLPVNEKSPAFNSMIIFNNLNVDASLEFLKLPKVVLTNSKYYNFYIDRLYAEQIRNKIIRVNYTKERKEIYDRIQSEYKYMKTPINIGQLMKRNTFYDLSVYNNLFFDNIGSVQLKKTIEMYFTLLNKVCSNPELSTFTNITICMNVDNWFKYTQNNPINYILIAARKFPELLSILGDRDFVFYTKEMILRVNPSQFNKNDYSILKRELGRMTKNLVSDDDMDKMELAVPEDKSSKKEIDIDPEIDDDIKEEVDKDIKTKTVKYSNSDLKDQDIIDLAKQDANNDEELVMKVDELIKEKKIGKSTASLKRDEELRKKQKEIRLKDKTVQELLDFKIDDTEIPVVDVSQKVSTTNRNVTQVRFNQFEKEYNEKLFESDTTKILTQLNDLDLKVYVKDIKIEDSSDSLNYKDTYKVILEDENRVRHSLTFDVPKFVDDKYLYINGNKKIISKQLFTKPIAKTGPDEVQVCSNYNKIFINRYGQKYSPKLEKFKKLISESMSGVKIVHGDASEINTRYKTVLEYDIISENLISIKTNHFELLFNQEDIQKRLGSYKLKEDDFCIGFYSDGKPIIMSYKTEKIDGRDIIDFIVMYGPPSLQNKFDELNISTKTFVYSRASIMSKKIPLVILLAYCEGITKVLQKAEIKYYFTDKKPAKSDDIGIIQFEDGYLVYDRYPFENSLLLDGLTTIPTKAYQYSQLDDKEIYIDMFGDIYGARNLANAFNTFYEFMIDPITKEILEELDYPTDFVSVLLVANKLLADNSYIMENNMNLYRVRSNEVVNALIHRELADAYANYRATANNTNPTKISIPKDAIIKKLLMINTVEEHSVLNPIYEIEKSHTISPRGLSGMNLEQSYTEDKRSYSDTMLGIIGMSTSPDGNVGVARKLTMEPNIKGARGFIDIQKDNKESLNDVNLFTAAEMLTPMGASHDDAIRTAIK